jgi:integrase
MRGNLTRRGKSSWRLKFEAGRDLVTQARITKYVTLKGTKTQAQAEAAKIIASAVTGEFVDLSQETVATFIESWINDWAAVNLSAKTVERYRELLRKHVAARVGVIPLQKLQASDLLKVYAAMAKAGLADRTRLHVHRVVHRMLGHAAKWGKVTRNAATLVDAPRVDEEELEILTADEIGKVLQSLRGRSLFPIVSLALATGMRRGELLALRWQEVDVDGSKLRVERSLEQTKQGLSFKAPKTRHGRRTITLPPTIVAELKAHRKAALERRIALGLGKLTGADLVFETWDAQVRSPRSVTKEWSRIMRAAGLKPTFHSLRHSHASALIAEGIDVMVLSRRLGHGSPAITLRLYGHLWSKTDDRAAAAIEKMLAKTE